MAILPVLCPLKYPKLWQAILKYNSIGKMKNQRPIGGSDNKSPAKSFSPGYATLAVSPSELVEQKLAVHESVVSAAIHTIQTDQGLDNAISAGLLYSLEELRCALEYAASSSKQV